MRSIYKVENEVKVKKAPYTRPKPIPETRIVSGEDMNMIIAPKRNKFDSFKSMFLVHYKLFEKVAITDEHSNYEKYLSNNVL